MQANEPGLAAMLGEEWEVVHAPDQPDTFVIRYDYSMVALLVRPRRARQLHYLRRTPPSRRLRTPYIIVHVPGDAIARCWEVHGTANTSPETTAQLLTRVRNYWRLHFAS